MFQEILRDLVESSGAEGALFLDESGEMIELSCDGMNPHDVRLLGAYMGIYLRQLQRFLDEPTYGELQDFLVESRRRFLFCRPLVDGYSVVLVQSAPALRNRTRHALRVAAQRLIEEMTGEAVQVD
ncbi:MAG: hypothetical protein DWQ36_17880 [Acidobacteria bacterium]|nr:MAG: hypothetical protein DWQ30_15670 [Acidobacteriota bacterium]REK04307.1 MAG: hypothetical protein DWQ36_17880 [Acidobacteriota bacterium]